MNGHPLLKKPKVEVIESSSSSSSEEEDPEEEEEPVEEEAPQKSAAEMEEHFRREQEEAFLVLVEHRTKEVEHLQQRVSYYQSQLVEAEKKLEDTKKSLARIRRQPTAMASNTLRNGVVEVKAERGPMEGIEGSSGNNTRYTSQHLGQDTIKSAGDRLPNRPPSPSHRNGVSSQNQTHSKPQLIIPAVVRNIPALQKMKEPANKLPSESVSLPTASTPTHSTVVRNIPALQKIKEPVNKLTGESSSLPTASTPTHSTVEVRGEKAQTSKKEAVRTQPKGGKRKLEEREPKDVIPLISSSSSSRMVNCQAECFLPGMHTRKLRSLVLCPTDHLFVTSALDGVVNLWQIQGRGSDATILNNTSCHSEKGKWPEDVAWHPHGKKLFSVYSADGEDTQVSILNLNKGKERTRPIFLDDKPHVKGIINSIMFMPWDDTPFVTGGSDHAVILWRHKDGGDSWNSQLLHRDNHSSAVMGVAGLFHKKVVMSVGADKRIIGVELETGRIDYKHQMETKCMSILPNPCDHNLVMVQTGTLERQLRLFDIRMKQKEIHSFGWKQESSELQSALIKQSWSPDGWHLTSGSPDPYFHIFDVRYNAHIPSQSIRSHQGRVFRAVWHHSLPLLITISADKFIGLHKVTK